MQQRKRKFISITQVVLSLAVAILLLGGCSGRMYKNTSVYDKEIPILDEPRNQANDYQHLSGESGVFLGAYNGKLCYSMNFGPLIQFGKPGNNVIGHFHSVLAIVDDYAYSSHYKDLYVTDLQTRQMKKLVQKPETGLNKNWYFFVNGDTLYVQANFDGTMYYPINKDEVGSPVEQYAYQLGDRYYAVESEDVVCYDSLGNRNVLDITYGDWRVLVPCNAGLLIHNYGQNNPLYLIKQDSGALIDLFPVECMSSITAVNVYGDYAYISVLRYEGLGDGLFDTYKRFENDSFEGTYRISLKDYSVQKISDEIYVQLYIFDKTGIFAVKSNGQTCKLDFEGNVLQTVIDVKPSILDMIGYWLQI